ncbi:MAG: DUF2027 domain-containing protein [Bacteroidales bacterium]
MKVSVGDQVRFLNEVGGGKVVEILDKRKVLVATEDGFEIPVLDSDLVVIDSVSDDKIKGTSNNQPHKDSKQKNLVRVDNDISLEGDKETDGQGDSVALQLAFVPRDINALYKSNIDLYIINDSSYRVFYALSKWEDGKLNLTKAGLLVPDTKELIKTYELLEINQVTTFNIQAIYYKNVAFVVHQPEFYDIELNPIKLQKGGNFTGNDFFDERAYIISVSDSYKEEMLKHLTDKTISEAIKQKEPKPLVKPVKKQVDDMEEVDLHIHELLDSWSGMTPGEIIQIQLARFETVLQGGLKGNTKKMVFIHGIGNGKLKYEITRVLDSKYPKLKYQDASFKEYGYGATLVYLK